MGKLWLYISADVAFAAGFGVLITGSPVTALRVFAVGVGIAVAFILGCGFHELAHAIVGNRRGLRILALAAWPVMLSREDGRLRVGLMPGIPKLGGFVLFDPWEKPASVLAPAMGASSLAGPLANLGLALLGTLALVVVRPAPWPLTASLIAFAIINLVSAAENLYPRRCAGVLTDGARYLAVRRGKETTRRMVVDGRLAILPIILARPRTWSPPLGNLAEEVFAAGPKARGSDETTWLLSAIPLYYLRIDRGEVSGAWSVLTSVEAAGRPAERHLAPMLSWLDALASAHLALWDRDPIASEHRRRTVTPRSPSAAMEFGVDAAIQLARGNTLEAHKLALRALRLLPAPHRRTGCQQIEAEWWERVIAEAEAQRSLGSASAHTPTTPLIDLQAVQR